MPSYLMNILDGWFYVSDSLTIDNMYTHDTPPPQVWVHKNEDMLVTVIVEETLNKRNLESIKTIPTEV